MVKLNSLRADLVAERDGVWAAYPNEPGLEFKIASSSSREFRDALENAMEPYVDLIRAGKLESTKRTAVVQEVAAEHLVRDWRGVEDDEGNPEPYSIKACASLLQDPAQYRIWSWVQEVAGSEQRYRDKKAQAAAKN